MTSFSDLGIQKTVATNVLEAVGVGTPAIIKGVFNVSIISLLAIHGSAPDFIGKVTLQRAFIDLTNNPESSPFVPPEGLFWQDIFVFDSTAASLSKELIDSNPGISAYRAVIKTGDYTQGKVIVRIGL